MLGGFVRGVHSADVDDLPIARPSIQPLRIALLAEGERRIDEDFDEAVRADAGPARLARIPERTDDSADGDAAADDDLARELADSPHVGATIGIRISEVRRQALSDVVTVEHLDAERHLLE